MPEAITKYAINSTLGTDEFKPLDQIIIGEKVFAANKTPIAPAYSNGKYYYFIAKLNGALSAKFSISNSSEMYNSNGSGFVLDESDNIIASSITYNVPSDSSLEFYLDFPVVKGKKYKVKIERGTGSGNFSFSGAFFCGQITDYNYFETEEVE